MIRRLVNVARRMNTTPEHPVNQVRFANLPLCRFIEIRCKWR